MKFVSFRRFGGGSEVRAGVWLPLGIIDLRAAAPLVFEESESRDWTLLGLLNGESEGMGLDAAANIAAAVMDELGDGADALEWDDADALDSMLSIGGETILYTPDTVRLLAPIPRPPSVRDFYAFEQHVKTAYDNMGRPVPPTWYELPVFYFGNPSTIYGPGEEVPMPRTGQLDYELEIAAVIGRPCRDVAAEDADYYIAGYTIMNDWSARDLQAREMKVGLGPAKGKDFATSLGPALVTVEEFEDKATGDGRYNLAMTVRVNGEERGRGSFADIYYPFGELIAQASRDVTLYPGDVIGSGTVGTGCLLETTAGKGPWLERGDVVELEIERLGILRNTIV
jgi:fumarylacetoacetate (FAA) hydrolase